MTGRCIFCTVLAVSILSVSAFASQLLFSSSSDFPAGDLDGDGDNDLVVANNAEETISIMKNNGDGTFAPKVDYPTGIDPLSVSAADLDRDGDFDVAVANANNHNVSVFFNNGDGTLAPRVDYPTGNNPYSVFAADFDGDGDPDLVTANF